MDRRRAAGALLALAACFACATAAPTASNQTALDLYDADSAEGCYYNFQHYGEGDRIMTNEPCLNCTCHNRMLMCYLRVCPFTKPIGQDCTVEKRADQCCPIVTCPDVPVDLLTSTPTTSPAEYGTTGVGRLDKYGCSINGKYFSEGSKVPPSPNKPCEHCYCIRNMTTCVMQECTLHVDGCTPIYHKEVCCPIRYSCDHQDDEVPMLDDMTTTVRPTPGFLLTTTTMASVTQIPQECVHDDQIFPDGALIKTEKACEHCYCMKGDIVCVVQECGTPMENEGKNCTSLAPREGQCCPDTYICEGDEQPTELPTEVPTETTSVAEAITEVQTENVPKGEKEPVTEVSTEATTQTPDEEATEIQKELSTVKPKAETPEGAEELPTELPQQTTAEAATEAITQSSTEAVTKEIFDTEGSGEEVSESVGEAATESSIPIPTEANVEKTTEAETEGMTEKPNETATDKSTEAETEATIVTTQTGTEKATQVPSEGYYEEPTTFVPPRRTSVEGSGYRNEPDELFTETPFLEPETEGSGEEDGTEKPSDADVTTIPIEEATSPARDEENEVTTIKEPSIYIPSSTEPPTIDTEQPTTEPDKGENTVPSDDTTLPSIFELPSSEAPVTKVSEESTSAVEQTTEIPEDKQEEQPSATTQESYTSSSTEIEIATTEIQSFTTESTLAEGEKVTEDAIIDRQGAPETIIPTTENVKLEIQTTIIPLVEQEPKSTTVQLPDAPVEAEATKSEEVTTESTQEYTTLSNKMKEEVFTTMQPIEEFHTTTTNKLDIPETTSINTLENEIHEEGPAILTPGIIPGEGNCLIDGITYNNDSTVPTSHKCQSSCRCMSSIVKCEELVCSPPPENMGDCEAVYESEETCCPYYTCGQVKDTPPLKPHSQMSGTEVPITQVDCDGELCNKQDDVTPDTQVSPQCESGDCSSESDKKDTEICGDAGCAAEQVPVLTPTKDVEPDLCPGGQCSSPPEVCTGESCQLPTRKHCGKDTPCDSAPEETCEGSNCVVETTPKKELTEPVQDSTQGCANPDDCKSSSPEINKPICDGDDCTVMKQNCGSGKCENVPVEVSATPDEQKEEDCGEGGCKKMDESQTSQPECTDEACIKKDVKDIDNKPSAVCADESCVQQATLAPTPNIEPMSTKLPELEDNLQTIEPNVEEKRTESPAETEAITENQTISDVAATKPTQIDTTAETTTEKQDIDSKIQEATTTAQESSSEEPEIDEIITKSPEITTETEPQGIEKTTAIPLMESQDSEEPQNETNLYVPTETPITDQSQTEIITTVSILEEKEPETAITSAPIDLTSLDTTIGSPEPTIKDISIPSKLNDAVPVTESGELITELPDALSTVLSMEPEIAEVTKPPQELPITELQETDQSTTQEAAATEGQTASPITEKGEFITKGSEIPEPTTEVPEIKESKVPVEISPVENELATKPQEMETTTVSNLDEHDNIVTGPPKEPALESQEPGTEIPNVPIIDEKDSTEFSNIDSSSGTTAATEKPTSMDQDASTEMVESSTNEDHYITTKMPEVSLSEEEQTIASEAPVTGSQDLEPSSGDHEQTTPSVYSVTELQGITEGLREGTVTEKEIVPSEDSVTNRQEIVTSAPEILEDNKMEEPESPVASTATLEEKTTVKPESPMSEIPEDYSISEIPVSTDQETIVTQEPAAEDQEKPIDENVPESETKIPDLPSKQDTVTEDSVTSVTEYEETATTERSVQDDEKATESPTIATSGVPQELPEVTTKETQIAGAEVPDVTQETEQPTEIPELQDTESQKPATDIPSAQPSGETEVPVVEPQEYVTETPTVEPTVEEQDLTTKAPEEQNVEPAVTETPYYEEKLTTAKDEMIQPEFIEPTVAPETEIPETETEISHDTETPEASTSRVGQQDVKQDEPQSTVTQTLQSVTESADTVTSEIVNEPTGIPEATEKEPQDNLTTTMETATEQTKIPVPDKEDAITQLPEIVKLDEAQPPTEVAESVTESQEIATKEPETDEQDVETFTSTSIKPDNEISTESFVETTQKVLDSGEQEIDNKDSTPSKPEEQEVYTNAPEPQNTESQDSTSTPAPHQDIPIDVVTQFEESSSPTPEFTIQQDIDENLVPESHVTESQEIVTEVPKQDEMQTESISPVTEPKEVFTNVPVSLVPEEQPTLPPAAEVQESATRAPEVPTVGDEGQTESPLEQSIVPEIPIIPDVKVTESPEITTTEGVITEAPEPVTEKQDISVTESKDVATDMPDIITVEPITQTSPPKVEYTETTPYLVELEEHTHKIEDETSTSVPDDISVPQATETYDKPEETSAETEIEKQTEVPVTTEKPLEVPSVESTTTVPTDLQENTPMEPGSLDTKLATDFGSSTPQEQSTPRTDIDDGKTPTQAEEVDEKIPETEHAVPVPIVPATEKEAESTTQAEAETEKYTNAPTTEKPIEVTSSQETSSEEDNTPLRTTTAKSVEEITTSTPIDKATTAEPKPTELPVLTSQETVKPTSSEEVPSEEDTGQFTPSGTGYGQEPDYPEEDQAFGPGTCRYGGKVYVSAQQIPRDDPCDFCFCFRSDIICLQQSCPPPIHGCHEEPIQGFCCPRYECPVSMATTLNMTTTTTTTTTTLPPHFLTHAYNGAAQKRGCLIKGNTYKVGEVVRASSGPCLHCTCGGDGQMKCDPKVCTPEPMLRQMIAAAVSAKRRR